MIANEPWELQLAWQRAWQMRGCPPDALLYSIDPDHSLAEHLQRCPFCREQREAGAAAAGALQEIASRMAHLAGVAQVGGTRLSPVPGQIWSMRRELSGWGPKGRYYNPPLVLVLDCPKAMPGALRVAQLFDDPLLAGAGDLRMTDDWLVESWNTYTLAENDLDRCLTTIAAEALESVLKSEQGPFPVVVEGSHLAAFRRLELEVGAFFSMDAVARLMARRKAGLFAVLSADKQLAKTIKGSLSLRHPKLKWAAGKLTDLEAIALARLAEYEMPLAAASGARQIPVNLLHVRTEIYLEPLLAEITVWDVRREGMVIGGRILGELPAGVELYARWRRADGSLAAPVEAMVDAREGFFRLRFADFKESELREGQLHLLLGAP